MVRRLGLGDRGPQGSYVVERVAGTGRSGVVRKDRKKGCRLYTPKTLLPNRTQVVCRHIWRISGLLHQL